ncbi:hypothetical protein BJP34_01415 [Moorena producens PAL-8-15-08-1]|uniref:Cobalamin biosynthesis protein CobQ n=1 Tax=Moorena producens PAL-8-15-08-1 TaxID=1458985 RepID=A0A1D8TKZ1_9CYAN|nr:hypothetical protein [Moorena producens]AOW98274.1 hypothetical protein BJP34_01415 [Moorena producens PAL-8-15-08-1]
MNTPAHAIVNLLILGKKRRPENNLPIVFGAILSDLPMVIFYGYEKLLRGIPENVIWSESYYNQSWQVFFDIFNSFPLILIGGLLAYYFGQTFLIAMFASMALHGIGDFPVHADDAHRHFFPLSNWRFESPVSYWDSRHYGHIFTPLEVLAVIVGCFVLWRRHTSMTARIIIAIVLSVYFIYGVYAVLVWG